MKKYYAFELFDTEEEAALRGTAIAVYLASDVDGASEQQTAVLSVWCKDSEHAWCDGNIELENVRCSCECHGAALNQP